MSMAIKLSDREHFNADLCGPVPDGLRMPADIRTNLRQSLLPAQGPIQDNVVALRNEACWPGGDGLGDSMQETGRIAAEGRRTVPQVRILHMLPKLR